MNGQPTPASLHEKAVSLLVETQLATPLSDGRFCLPQGFIATITDRLSCVSPGGEPSLVITYRAE